jgi:hypothetical protein
MAFHPRVAPHNTRSHAHVQGVTPSQRAAACGLVTHHHHHHESRIPSRFRRHLLHTLVPLHAPVPCAHTHQTPDRRHNSEQLCHRPPRAVLCALRSRQAGGIHSHQWDVNMVSPRSPHTRARVGGRRPSAPATAQAHAATEPQNETAHAPQQRVGKNAQVLHSRPQVYTGLFVGRRCGGVWGIP